MADSTLSDEAMRFLTGEVATVECLDLLLFLHRNASRWWGAEALTEALGMPISVVQSHLEHLSSRNLLDIRVAESVIYCYKPGREDLARLVEEVAGAHYRHRNEVAAVLARRTHESARLFADAFQFWKGRRDG